MQKLKWRQSWAVDTLELVSRQHDKQLSPARNRCELEQKSIQIHKTSYMGSHCVNFNTQTSYDIQQTLNFQHYSFSLFQSSVDEGSTSTTESKSSAHCYRRPMSSFSISFRTFTSDSRTRERYWRARWITSNVSSTRWRVSNATSQDRRIPRRIWSVRWLEYEWV